MAQAQAKAKGPKSVKRVITGPKPMTIDGEVYQPGDTVNVPPHAAKAFAEFLENPRVAKAKAAAAAAEAEEAEAEAQDEGGDSAES